MIHSYAQKKGSKNKIFEEMNNFHQDLNFTEEPMKNKQLTFLDMTLFIDEDDKIQTKIY